MNQPSVVRRGGAIQMLRGRLRFSIRTLLLLLTAFSVWLGLNVRSAREQEKAVRQIREYGGWVRYDFQFSQGGYAYENFDPNAKTWVPNWLLEQVGIDFFHSVVEVNLVFSEDSGEREENGNFSDAVVANISKLGNLRNLLVTETQVTDGSMRHLAELKRLERLQMWAVREVSDSGVQYLASLKHLQDVDLNFSKISDDSLRVLAQLPCLETLDVQGIQLTDEGLEHLADVRTLRKLWVNMPYQGDTSFTDLGISHLSKLDALEKLVITGSGITDVGLQQLGSLKQLKNLSVSSNAVTKEGISSLKKRLPAVSCKLYHSSTHYMGPWGFGFPQEYWELVE